MARLTTTSAYTYPFGHEAYPPEPTHDDAVRLARGLAHYLTAYAEEPSLTVGALIRDLLTADGDYFEAAEYTAILALLDDEEGS